MAVAIGVLVCIPSSTVAVRWIEEGSSGNTQQSSFWTPFIHGPDVCRSTEISECNDREGCTACKVKIPVVDVYFCINETSAERLPEALFTCGVDPEEKGTNGNNDDSKSTSVSEDDASNAIEADECFDLDENGCEANANCAWCESAAVRSACYTIDQAKRLPTAVFECKLPSF